MSRRAWLAFAANSVIWGVSDQRGQRAVSVPSCADIEELDVSRLEEEDGNVNIRIAHALLVWVALAALPACAVAAPPAWTTYRHDGARSGIDPDSSSPVPPAQLWQTSAPLDGQIYGQPLVFGTLVYVATENDTVYALDAATGQVVWQKHVGTPVPDVQNAGCGNIGDVGITGTPVIDPATNRIYAVADTWDGGTKSTIHHLLVGFDAATGAGAPGLPVVVDPPGSAPAQLLQRAALGIDARRVIIGFGGNSGDCGSYHGWLVGAPESGAGGLVSFKVDPNSERGAIWGSGTGPAIDAAGQIWAETGNGSGSTYDLQESVVKLAADLSPLDSWAPVDWQSLDAGDADLGSSEPLLLPGGLVFAIGKQGIGYLLSQANLGHGPSAPAFGAKVCGGTPGGSFGGGVYVNGVIYVTCTDGMRALALNTAAPAFTPVTGFHAPSGSIGPPIIAAGQVWSVDWRDGAVDELNPSSGAVSFSAKLSGFNHFASPGAGGGRLFVANGDQVTAFTIARPPPPPPPGHTPPVITKARILPRRGRLTLALSASAHVTVVIFHRFPGRVSHGRCRRARHGRRCTRLVRKLHRTFSAAPGANAFPLRLGRLRGGRYVATIVAHDSLGARSTTTRLRFRIRRHRG